MSEVAALAGPATRVLDLGCGTGRFTVALAERLGALVIGIDPSALMLSQARSKRHPRVSYVRAAAERLPLAAASVSLLFMSQVFHHLNDRQQALRECRRVLTRSGRFLMRCSTLDERVPFEDFFPETTRLMRERIPGRAELRETIEASGFALTHHSVIEQQVAINHAAYADNIALRGDSLIASLSHSDFEAGLRALRSFAASPGGGAPVRERIDLFVFEPV